MSNLPAEINFSDKQNSLNTALRQAGYTPTIAADGSLTLSFSDEQAPTLDKLVNIQTPDILTADFFTTGNSILDLLPDGLSTVLTEIKFHALSLTPQNAGVSFSFSITLGWVGWSSSSLPVSLAELQITITKQGAVFSGALSASNLHIKDVPLDMSMSATFPGFLLEAELTPANASSAQLMTSLTSSELSGHPAGKTTPSLHDLTIRAALHEPRFMVHLAVDNLVDLECFVVRRAQVDLLYDGPAQIVSGAAWAMVEIPYTVDSTPYALDLLVRAELEVPFGQSAANPSWALYGSTVPGESVELGVLIDSLVHKLSSGSGETLPYFIRKLTLQNLALGYSSSVVGTTQTKKFAFDCALQFNVTDSIPALLTVQVTFTQIIIQAQSTTTHKFEGKLTIGQEIFTLDVTSQAQTNATIQLLLARYQHEGALDLGELTSTVAPPELSQALSGIELNIDEVLFAILSATPKPKRYLFGVDLGLDLDLTKLPVAGSLLGSGTYKIDNLRLYLASDVFWEDDVKVFPAEVGTRLLPSGDAPATTPPTKRVALTKGVNFRADLTLGGSSSVVPSAPGNVPADTPEGASGNQPNPDTTGATWLDVQKSFGPINIARIGGAYRDQHVWFYLDAALKLGVLTLTLDGLGAGLALSLSDLDPKFSIRGMSLTYQSGPVEMSGGFIANQAMDAFAGEIIVKLELFALSAIGMYADIGGFKSAFIFVMVNVPLGGPPPFFVTGLAGGFGYNTHLRVPKIEEVKDFLLVKAALPDSQSASNPLAGKSDPKDILPQLLPSDSGTNSVLTIEKGEYWFAAGLRFTSFDLINTLAMVVIEFGNELEIAVIGLASISLPPPPVPGGEPLEKYAYAELAIEVLILPAQGLFEASAILTPASFVLDPNCKLTGGFAFYVWFGDNPHAGEFVLTVGGYNPHFDVPSYYPNVPRLGFNWSVSDVLTIDGQAYFALTHSAVMAGGRLEVLFHKSFFSAWAIARMDVLICWAPFHYDLEMEISIGVAAHVKIGALSVTLKVEMGVSLALWGPSLGGKAHVSWYIVSFTIHFGDDNDPKPHLPWTNDAGTGFAQTLLPNQVKAQSGNAPTSFALGDAPQVADSQLTGLYSITAQSGLLTQLDNPDHTKTWIVSPSEFTFSITSVIPTLEVVDCAQGESDPAQMRVMPCLDDAGNPIPLDYTDVPVRPMNTTLQTSRLEITLTYEGQERIFWVSQPGDNSAVLLAYSPAYATVPAAKWGVLLGSQGNTLDEAKTPLTGRLVGIAGVRAQPHGVSPTGDNQLLFTVGDTFSYDTIANPSLTITTLAPEKPPQARTTTDQIHSVLSDASAAQMRSAMLSVLQGCAFLPGATALTDDPFNGHPEQWLYGLPLVNQD